MASINTASLEHNMIAYIAMAYADTLKGAIIAQRMGDSEAYHRLTDYVMTDSACELWELVEALDIINIKSFEGENPFTARLQIAENMRQLAEAEKAETERLRDILARKQIYKNDIEGAILARQEKSEHWL